MTGPTINEDLTKLLRDFLASAREKIKERIDKTDPEKLAERSISTVLAIAAALRLWAASRIGRHRG